MEKKLKGCCQLTQDELTKDAPKNQQHFMC